MARLARPPGPHINVVLAVIGQMFPKRFPFDPLAFGVSIAREFGDIAHYQVGPLHVYQLSHPDFAKQILVEEPEKFYKARLIKQAFGAFAGQGLLTSDGVMWKQQRKLIQPAFHHAQLMTYGALMVGHTLRIIDSLEDGAVVEIHEVMPRLTLAIVIQTLFGADVTREATDVGRLMVAVLDAANDRLNRILRLPSWVPTRRNLREKRALARLDELFDSFIAAHRAAGEKSADLLSTLLAATDEDSGIRMSDRLLHEEMMTLFLAGHETTAMALTWTWYLLSQHPEVVERLVREVSRVLGGRAPTVADLPELP
jgi:cytochrome P450